MFRLVSSLTPYPGKACANLIEVSVFWLIMTIFMAVPAIGILESLAYSIADNENDLRFTLSHFVLYPDFGKGGQLQNKKQERCLIRESGCLQDAIPME